jgi:excisionase family DNA binding protein
MNTHDTAPLCTKIAARVVGVDPRTMEQWRYQGKGPAYLKVGRQVRYRRHDIDAWLHSRRIEPEGHGLH